MIQTLRSFLLVAVAVTQLGHAEGLRVVDDLDREVVLAQPAQRIVTLSPHLTELIFEIGAGEQLVAVSSYSNYPPLARQIGTIGDAFRIDYERLVALQPDLVLVWGSGNAARTLKRLEDLGITAFVSEPRRLEQIRTSLLRLGILTGRDQQSAQAARSFATRLAALRESARHISSGRLPDAAPARVFVQLDHAPLYTVNGEHLISEVLELCNGRNVFAELAVLAPTVSIEAVLAADPQAIIASETIPSEQFPGRWLSYPGLSATREQGFLRIDPDLMHRQSSRILDAAQQVCEFLQAQSAAATES